MKEIVEEKKEIKKKIDIYKILDNIPCLVEYHINCIKEEIDSIIQILKSYDDIKNKFNKSKFSIDGYITNFLSDIRTQAEFITKENKLMEKELKKVDNKNIIFKSTSLPIKSLFEKEFDTTVKNTEISEIVEEMNSPVQSEEKIIKEKLEKQKENDKKIAENLKASNKIMNQIPRASIDDTDKPLGTDYTLDDLDKLIS